MRRPGRRRHRTAYAVASAVALAAGTVGVLGGTAAAAGDPWDLAWRTSPAEWDGLHPGAVRSAELDITNRSEAPLQVRLAALDVIDDENGCLRQELHSDLEDCGVSGSDGSGELGDQLLVTLHDESGRELYAGPLRGLTDESSPALALPASTSSRVSLAIELPASSTNETMTDRVSFTVRATARAVVTSPLPETPSSVTDRSETDAPLAETGTGQVVEVLGEESSEDVEVETGTDDSRSEEDSTVEEILDGLPATGSPAGVGLLALGGGLVTGGGVLCVASRRRRRDA